MPPNTGRPNLRIAVAALLAACDATGNGPPWLATHFDALRAAITVPPRVLGARTFRPDTKRSLVVGMVRRSEGATVAQVTEVTGWARHTVYGFFAGLKKQGTPIEVLDRVRQVGAGQGAKGSYTVSRRLGV